MMFTIDPDKIEKGVLSHVPQQFQRAVEKVVLAGEKILFTNPTSKQIFDSIRPNVPVADELGAGAVHLMMLLYQESKQSMPLQAFIPAGTILIAKAAKFINDTKIAPITDEDYSEAVNMFVTVTYSKFDPNFAAKVQQSGGAPASPAATQLNQGG